MCYISLKTKDLAALLPEISSGCNFFLSCVEQSQPHDFFFFAENSFNSFLSVRPLVFFEFHLEIKWETKV